MVKLEVWGKKSRKDREIRSLETYITILIWTYWDNYAWKDYVTGVPLISFPFQGPSCCPHTGNLLSQILPCNLSSCTQLFFLRDTFMDHPHYSNPSLLAFFIIFFCWVISKHYTVCNSLPLWLAPLHCGRMWMRREREQIALGLTLCSTQSRTWFVTGTRFHNPSHLRWPWSQDASLLCASKKEEDAANETLAWRWLRGTSQPRDVKLRGEKNHVLDAKTYGKCFNNNDFNNNWRNLLTPVKTHTSYCADPECGSKAMKVPHMQSGGGEQDGC